jgi:hypothetical protein
MQSDTQDAARHVLKKRLVQYRIMSLPQTEKQHTRHNHEPWEAKDVSQFFALPGGSENGSAFSQYVNFQIQIRHHNRGYSKNAKPQITQRSRGRLWMQTKDV